MPGHTPVFVGFLAVGPRVSPSWSNAHPADVAGRLSDARLDFAAGGGMM